jgi:ATP-dependent DNA ligase
VVLFKPVPLLKPIHGRTKGEIYSIDSVVDTIKSRKTDWFKANIVVQKKFDGVHCQADKKEDIVRIWTEDGTEITKNCPTLVKELAGKRDDFKVLGEIELWKEDKHQNRAITAGVLNTKDVHPDEKFLVFNLFDCLFHKSRDIHMSPYSERLHHLKSFLFVKKELRVKLAETRIAKTESELRNALEYFSKLEGSEGAYLKLLTFLYNLTGRTTDNIKFKNELSVEVQIVKVNVVGEKK